MKTPDEIKKGEQCCSAYGDCAECPYSNCGWVTLDCKRTLAGDGLDYIRQLEANCQQVSKALCGKENATLDEVLQAVRQVKADASRKDDTIRNLTELLNAANDEAAKYKRERDAAVKDIPLYCTRCVHGNLLPSASPCNECRTGMRQGHWQWRGVCPENAEVQK